MFTISILLLSDSDTAAAKRSRSGRILKPRIFPTSFQNPVISDIPIECIECQVLVDQGMLEEYRNHHRTAHFEGQQIKSKCESVNHGLAARRRRLAIPRGPEITSYSRPFFLEYPPKCSVCHGIRSRTRGTRAYLIHYRAVHLKIKEFSCGNCGKKFSSRGNLDKHDRAVHLKIKAFSCGICGKEFIRNAHLNEHNRNIHLKIKSFSCGECGKKFSKRGNLDKHHRAVHLKIKSFSCGICGMNFSENGNLKKHNSSKKGCKPLRETSDQEEEEAPSK